MTDEIIDLYEHIIQSKMRLIKMILSETHDVKKVQLLTIQNWELRDEYNKAARGE